MVLTAAFSRAPGAAEPRPGMLRGLLGVAGALGVAAISDKDGKVFPTSPLVPRVSGGRDSAEVMQELSKEQAQPLSPDPAAPRAVSQSSHILRDKPTQEQDTLRALSQGIVDD